MLISALKSAEYETAVCVYEWWIYNVRYQSQCNLKFQLKMFNKEAFRGDHVLCVTVIIVVIIYCDCHDRSFPSSFFPFMVYGVSGGWGGVNRKYIILAQHNIQK